MWTLGQKPAQGNTTWCIAKRSLCWSQLMDSVFWSYAQALKQVPAKRKEKPESSWQRQQQLGNETTDNLQEERQRAVEKYWFISVKWKVHGPGQNHLLSQGSFSFISQLFALGVNVLRQWMKMQSQWFQICNSACLLSIHFLLWFHGTSIRECRWPFGFEENQINCASAC